MVRLEAEAMQRLGKGASGGVMRAQVENSAPLVLSFKETKHGCTGREAGADILSEAAWFSAKMVASKLSFLYSTDAKTSDLHGQI